MRRIVVMCLAVWLLTEASWAQRQPTVPMAAVSEEQKLAGKGKIRYLLRQLDLSEEQREYARGLITTILDEPQDPPLSLEQVYTLMAEAQQAEKDGDEERAERVKQQMRELGRGADRESEFFMNMETELTAEQNESLRAARARLKRNPSGALRPVDVFRIAYQLDLTQEQKAQLDRWHARFREDLRKVRALDDEQRFQLMNGLLERLRTALTPEQRTSFELGIRRLRPDLATRGLRVRIPATQPAAAGENQEQNKE